MSSRLALPGDPDYPTAFLDLPDPPRACHWGGPAWPPRDGAVAVVGSRAASPYGRERAEELGFELARRGIPVVSGLARGIDAAAHRGALAAGGAALAVVACDPARPPLDETADLHRRLLEAGAVCAEFGPEVTPRPGLFVRRNRLVAALARVVVVVEAGESSGALETAKWTRRLGRHLAAVPGDVTRDVAQGPLRLLQQGAAAVACAADVVALLAAGGPDSARRGGSSRRSGSSDPLLAALQETGAEHPDRLARRLGCPLPSLLARLAEWELAGRVRRDAGGRYRLLRREEAE